MRILIYGLNFSPELTGVGKYTGELAAFLAGKGDQVRVVTSYPYYPAWKVTPGYNSRGYSRESLPVGENSIEVIRCPLWVPARPGAFQRVVHLLSFALSSLPVCVWQAAWKPDVVFCVAPAAVCAPAALLTASLSKAATWLHLQDFEIQAARSLGFFRRGGFLLRIANSVWVSIMKRFDRVSTISENMLNALGEEGIPSGKLYLFPNWIDVSAVRHSTDCNGFRRDLNLSGEDIVVLFSGSMTRKQSLGTAAGAARILAGQGRIHFVFCGEGAGRAELVEDAGSLPNVHFLPLQPAEEINRLMNTADVHLLPQAAAAADLVFPSKIGAILASGRPVVATAGPETAVGRLVRGAGLVTPPGDAAALAGAVQYLADHPQIRMEMGRQARTTAETHFSAGVILPAFHDHLTGLLTVKRIIP